MPTLQIRNLSEQAYTALKARALADRRSVQQEAAWLLETMLQMRGNTHTPNWDQADSIQKRMSRRYGMLSDSTSMIRDMRDER